MAVFYKLHQEKRKESKFKGQWYARAVATETVNTMALADIMQQNCTLKRSDIVAVIAELVDVMKQQLQDSKRIKLDGLGTFKIGLNTKPAAKAEDFNVTKNVVGTHVLFRPEVRVNKDKSRVKALLHGCKVRELPDNKVEKARKKALSGAGGGSVTPPSGH